jgi:2-oxoglutarate ferredoxin oxidoreductase subunit beta
VIRRAASHTGSAFTEIYQNCNVFNDGAFEDFRAREHKAERQLHLVHGEPMLFGEENTKGMRFNLKQMALEAVTLGEPAGSDGKVIALEDILVHDETNHVLASMLAGMAFPEFPVALGVLYRSERASYDAAVHGQMTQAKLKKRSLNDLLRSGDTWTAK